MIRRLQLLVIAAILLIAAFSTELDFLFYLVYLAILVVGGSYILTRLGLADLEAGCSAPVGALAEVVEGEDGPELWMRAVVLSEDGALTVRRSATGDVRDAQATGERLAKEMLEDGASELMNGPP